MRAGIVIPLVGLVIVACGVDSSGDDGVTTTPDEVATSTPDRSDSEAGDTTDPDRADTTTPDRGDPSADTVPEQPDPMTGEVPDEIMRAILEDASDRTGAAVEDLEVTRAEAVTWPDGSLGCPQPGEFYTQALVDGYWVELVAGDEMLDYRAADSGYFKLCEGQQTPHSNSDSDSGSGGSSTGYGSGENTGPPSGSPDS